MSYVPKEGVLKETVETQRLRIEELEAKVSSLSLELADADKHVEQSKLLKDTLEKMETQKANMEALQQVVDKNNKVIDVLKNTIVSMAVQYSGMQGGGR